MMGVFSYITPYALYQALVAVCGYVLFLVRGICIALGDSWVMYVRVGKVWRQPSRRAPSLDRRDLVMQLAAASPLHSRVCATDALLQLNDAFIDRCLWKGLSEPTAAPSVVITGVSYGGIGFYTALHCMLAGVNVHGILRHAVRAKETEAKLQAAVDRQCTLHKEWTGKIGQIMLHTCDMSDTVAVVQLADKLISDPNLRVIVCNAGPMCSPPRLSPQHLEEQFATHHAGHSLLVLRLLQHRLKAKADGERLSPSQNNCATNRRTSAPRGSAGREGPHPHYTSGLSQPRWRIIITSSGAAAAADPTLMTTFHRWTSLGDLWWHVSRFSGYGNAKMCELLFAFALDRFLRSDRQLAACCTVNVLHPGSTRSRVISNSGLPLQWLLDGELAAQFRMTPVIASLLVTDLCLSKRYEQTSGHFFRMGEDQSEYYAAMVADPRQRCGFFRNSTLWPGIPGPRVALSTAKQDWLWTRTLSYFEIHGLLESSLFR